VTGDGAESLGGRLADVVAELSGVERAQGPNGDELRRAGRLFAVLGQGSLEVQLDPLVGAAARRTPDVTASPRGPGWVLFRPRAIDQFALDRAEAWLRSAHRLAAGAPPRH
jgi:hypothetical protein